MVSPCSSPDVTDSPGGSSRVGGLHGYGMEIKILWVLGAVGTVGSWLAAFGSALSWRLRSVSTPDAAAWVGGSAWSRPWLYLPSLPMPGDIPGSFPLHDILGLSSCPHAGCSA